MDFNKAHLYEATLNLIRMCDFFPRLSIASVDGKHLSEVVFRFSSAFHCKEHEGLRVVPVHPGLVTTGYRVHKVGVTVFGIQYILGIRI